VKKLLCNEELMVMSQNNDPGNKTWWREERRWGLLLFEVRGLAESFYVKLGH
jgi:hypothetical protein